MSSLLFNSLERQLLAFTVFSGIMQIYSLFHKAKLEVKLVLGWSDGYRKAAALNTDPLS